jgi:hypothetical protein
MVDRELDFISIFRNTWWDSHDSSIANENIELVFRLLEEYFGGLGDGAK